MKILIFGASGATGHHLVSQALAKGHHVLAFVRNPLKINIQNQNLRIHRGDVSNIKNVEDAVSGQEAVLSALGASNPIKRDYTLIKGVENIVHAMTRFHVDRLVYQSFLGVKEYREDFGFLLNRVIPFLLQGSIKDHEIKENMIVSSGVKWTIVRCPTLTNGPFTGDYIDGERIVSRSAVPVLSRADVADFMLRQLHETTYFNRKPRIMKK